MNYPARGPKPDPTWNPDSYAASQRFKRQRSLIGTAREAYAGEHYRRPIWHAISRPLLIVGALALIVVVVKQAGVLQ